jgi:hypothetical protein
LSNEQTPNNNSQFVGTSRGYKTKGNEYKDRYVEKVCPECKHTRAYKDTWRTRIAYTCLKRACRHKWYEKIEPVAKEEE